MMTDSKPWDEMAKVYKNGSGFTEQFAYDAFHLFKNKNFKDGRILDNACGTGVFTLIALQETENQAHVVATDISQPMLDNLQMSLDKIPSHNVESYCLDGQDLNLIEDESITHAGCIFGVMFFNDLSKGLREMHRVLKKDGEVVIAVWKEVFTMYLADYMGKKLKIFETSPFNEFIHRFYDPKYIIEKMESVGFKDVSVTTVTHPWPEPSEEEKVYSIVFSMPFVSKYFKTLKEQDIRDAFKEAYEMCLKEMGIHGTSHIAYGKKG